MYRLLSLSLAAVVSFCTAAGAVTQSVIKSYAPRGVSISLHDPIGSVYQEGEEVGFTIRTDKDAYVIVFNIDTDGFVHLLYPAGGGSLQRFGPNRVYTLPEGPGEAFGVEGAKGLEFVFAVAVADRDAIHEDEVHFLARNETLPVDRKFRITGDPFLGANRIVEQLVRKEALRSEATISFTYFYIGEAVDFPRYLCENCYEKGKDPYGGEMPGYVAVADFENTNGLTYPLAEGFASERAAAGNPQTQSTVTKVYVSYYPRWDDGFYATSWWYSDPWYWNMWYWDPWYAPYSGFYFSIGWNWGWGAYHYQYFPYYYGGPYYAYRPYWGYYNCYPYYGYSGYGSWYYPAAPYPWRSYGVVPKGQRTSALHTAMNQRVNKDFGVAHRSVKSFDTAGPRVAGTKSLGGERSIQSSQKRTASTATAPQVIRSKPVRESKDTRMVTPRDQRRESGEIRSIKTPYREQRVITRQQGTARVSDGDRSRAVDTKRLGGEAAEIGRRAFERGKSQTGVTRDGNVRKPESRGTYTPNVRRGGGEKSAPARSTGSSMRSAPPPSKSSAPARTAPSSGAAPRQKR